MGLTIGVAGLAAVNAGLALVLHAIGACWNLAGAGPAHITFAILSGLAALTGTAELRWILAHRSAICIGRSVVLLIIVAGRCLTL